MIIRQTIEGIKIKMIFEFKQNEVQNVCNMISAYPFKEAK